MRHVKRSLFWLHRTLVATLVLLTLGGATVWGLDTFGSRDLMWSPLRDRERVSIRVDEGDFHVATGPNFWCGTGLQHDSRRFGPVSVRRSYYSLNGGIHRTYVVPVLLVTGALAAYPAAFLGVCLGRRRWRKPGTCLSCGYDLNALESTTCPECGRNVASINA